MGDFKIIPNFTNYEINEKGVLRNINTKRILKTKINPKTKRVQVNLRDEFRIQKTMTIHRLIALAHLPNPYNLPAVDHIDRDPSNNNIINLRWVENKVNMQNKLINKNCMYFDDLSKSFIVQSKSDVRFFKYNNFDDALIHFKKLVLD